MKLKFEESDKKLIKEIGFAMAYKLLLDVAFLVILQTMTVEYYYADFNFAKWIIGTSGIILLIVFIQEIKNDYARFIIKLLFAITMIPVATIYAGKNYNTIFYISMIIEFIIILSTVYCLPKIKIMFTNKIKLKKTKANRINVSQIIYYVFLLNTIIVFFACIIYNGFFSFAATDLTKVYEIRKQFYLPHYITYLFQFETKFIILCLIVIYLHKKAYVRASLMAILQGMFFLWKGDKFTLFSTFVVIIFYLLFKKIKKEQDKYIYPIFAGTVGICSITILISKNLRMIFSLFVRRLLIVPANLKFIYFDFFSSHDKIGIVGTIINFIFKQPSPYSVIPYQNMIAGQYFENYEMYSNTGAIVEGFARWGYAGLVIIGIIMGIVILAIAHGTKNNKVEFIAGISIIPIIALNDGYLLPSLLFGGILFLLITCYGMKIDNVNLLFGRRKNAKSNNAS